MAKEIVNKQRDFDCELYDDEFEGAHAVSAKLRELANMLCEKQGMDVPTQQVLFLYDMTAYTGGPMGGAAALPPVARELYYQATGCMFPVAVTLKKHATSQLCEAQLSHVLYHCMRHLVMNEKTKSLEVERRHEVEGWREQTAFADGGTGYAEDAPNLFDKKIFPSAKEEKGGEANGGNAQVGESEAA